MISPTLLRDMADCMRDMLFDLDPDSEDKAYDTVRDVLTAYEMQISGEQLPLGIDEEETE